MTAPLRSESAREAVAALDTLLESATALAHDLAADGLFDRLQRVFSQIPPGDPEFPMAAEYAFSRDAILYHMSPHMHGRGKWMQFEAVYPDAHTETLLAVPYYEYDWQHQYWLKEPKRLPAGSRIRVTGAFDNSASNPFNLDPKAWVYFGLQTKDEMFMGYFHFAYAP